MIHRDFASKGHRGFGEAPPPSAHAAAALNLYSQMQQAKAAVDATENRIRSADLGASNSNVASLLEGAAAYKLGAEAAGRVVNLASEAKKEIDITVGMNAMLIPPAVQADVEYSIPHYWIMYLSYVKQSGAYSDRATARGAPPPVDGRQQPAPKVAAAKSDNTMLILLAAAAGAYFYTRR